eukprot:maker-scaffold_3-snap-gene-3.11-mRNA-1 protein AED:0.00 eAED:0.00 QI:157/1/1/1/1/1/2/58/141
MPQVIDRQCLLWLQSLDLTTSYKNYRRDYSNGYLVGQILSRYFPERISESNFANCTSRAEKESNWKFLEKILSKVGFNSTEHSEEIKNIILCNSLAKESCLRFLASLFEFLEVDRETVSCEGERKEDVEQGTMLNDYEDEG